MGKYLLDVDLVLDTGKNPDGTAGISAGYLFNVKYTAFDYQ
jgi:hypothetical protein